MYNVYWGLGILVIFFGLYQIGRKKQAKVARMNDQVLASVNESKMISRIVYHGGLPEMPKPSPMYAGISPLELLLWNDRVKMIQVSFLRWLNCEKITTEVRPDTRGLLVTTLGPLIHLFSRSKLRFFIVIKYVDCNDEKNNILLECQSQSEQNQLYETLHDKWNNCSRRSTSKLKTKGSDAVLSSPTG